jgi:hypothetical protein
MNQLKFPSVLLCAAMAFFLTSCGGSEEKTNTGTTTSDSTVTTATSETTPEANVVTTSENIMIARHKVSNYAKWKDSYEAHDSLRVANGLHSYVIGRGVEDSNTVMVAVKADDMAKAKAFAKDPSLKQAMQKGGVVGTPSFRFTTVVYQDMAKNISDLRAMNMFTVKDWEAWKKSFESSRQIRADNGLTDRAYGYDADDNHKVILVLAINDTAKAEAFWKSDLIKQRRAEGGVVGDVQRFVYRVVQKY